MLHNLLLLFIAAITFLGPWVITSRLGANTLVSIAISIATFLVAFPVHFNGFLGFYQPGCTIDYRVTYDYFFNGWPFCKDVKVPPLISTDEQEWQKAARLDLENAYRTYLRLFPSGKFRAAALERITQLKMERKFWSQKKDSKRPEDLREYIQRYPAGKFVVEARQRLTILESERLRIKKIQTRLSDLGCGPIKPDGIWGPETAQNISQLGYLDSRSRPENHELQAILAQLETTIKSCRTYDGISFPHERYVCTGPWPENKKVWLRFEAEMVTFSEGKDDIRLTGQLRRVRKSPYKGYDGKYEVVVNWFKIGFLNPRTFRGAIYKIKKAGTVFDMELEKFYNTVSFQKMIREETPIENTAERFSCRPVQ